MAQDSELKNLIIQIEQAQSDDRIRSLCAYFDKNVHSRTPEKFDRLLKACLNIAEKDQDLDFKAYLEFYKRIKSILIIPDDNPSVRESKMPKIVADVLKYYQSIGDERFIAICNAYIGHYHFILKEYEKSLDKLIIADEGFKKVGYDQFPDISKHLHNLALVLYFFRDYDKVIELMHISSKMPPYQQNIHTQLYNTLGAALSHQKQIDKAEEAFLKTKEIAISYNDTFWIAYASRNLANIYIKKEKYPEALQLYESNLKFISQYKNSHIREYYHYLLGLIKTYILLNDLPKAKKYLNSINYQKNSDNDGAMFLFGVSYQDINYWVDYYDVQQRYNNATKDYKKAYLYSDSLYSIKFKIDSLYNKLEVQVARNRINAQKNQYENDKKEAIIKSKSQQVVFVISLLVLIIFGLYLLYRKNRKINKQNKVISSQLEELSETINQKQVLLSELQHRVKNNLQHVISILEIQKESVDFNNIEELIRGNQNRIHSMALLHKKLKLSDNVNDVNLKKYITELAELVKESYDSHNKQINLIMTCDIESISIEKGLPIGLILTELVSNSMKHAFKNRKIGIIHIQITHDVQTGQHTFYYVDNGEGFDFNQTSEKGLGQEIIKGLIDQLDGKTSTKNKNGFELWINF